MAYVSSSWDLTPGIIEAAGGGENVFATNLSTGADHPGHRPPGRTSEEGADP